MVVRATGDNDRLIWCCLWRLPERYRLSARRAAGACIAMGANSTMKLPMGCAVRDLTTHGDNRGNLTEIFRLEWDAGIEPVQWNFVRSQANVLRGVHVHVVHSDYLVCLEGTMVLGLWDIRPESPTHGLATTVTLKGSAHAGGTGSAWRRAWVPLSGAFEPMLCGVALLEPGRRDWLSLGRPGRSDLTGKSARPRFHRAIRAQAPPPR